MVRAGQTAGELQGLTDDAVSRKSPGSDLALARLTAADLERVNSHILDRMQSPVTLIPRLAGHLVASGGKRLRPMLTLAAAQLCGYRGDRHIGLAACVEFIQTATLLHDDVVDASDLRRGRDTANALWGNQAPVLVGDFLFSRAFQLMVADGSLPVLKILSDAAATIAEGEVLQLTAAGDPATPEELCLRIIAAKTAALFCAACRVGAAVAEREALDAPLADYGMNLGIAFQLVDDLLDYSARQETLGKTVGDDFREGKATLPVILAFRQGGAEDRRFWNRVIAEGDRRDGDLEQALELMRRTGALDQTAARARAYGGKALAALDRCPDGPPRQALAELVAFNLERTA